MRRGRRAPALPAVSLARSRLLAIGLAVLHGGGLAALAAAGLAPAARLGLAAALAVSAYASLRRWYFDPAGERVVGLRSAQAGVLELVLGDGTILQASVAPSSAVLGPLIVVMGRDEDGHMHRIVVLPDSTDADSRRRLRVWLRWASRPDSVPDAVA